MAKATEGAPTKGAHVIVIGNEKGGSGKSTTAMHLIVALLELGRNVAAIDLDLRQGTLSRYLSNRRAYCKGKGIELAMPGGAWDAHGVGYEQLSPDAEAAHLQGALDGLAHSHEVIVIDTPGVDNSLSRLGHSYADTLVTPLNDSLVDLDVLARVDGADMKIIGPSHYAEMMWEQKKVRAARDGGSIDWIVMRNRLSSLDARNKRRMDGLLGELSRRFGFRMVAGFGERVIYRELFLSGLTMMDLRRTGGESGLTMSPLTMSHVAARQEVRNLVKALNLDS
ncbi:MAG: division plane positioning ATPase MipZ [Rhodospirillales bacterium]